ncbi:MAG: aromatic ring-hydroxylating dioxygenase subunit alpha [Candidatus Eremiobacteraeota bacterium]|nr:aromatic ring-hydroxylating dioxygenase subunit alpha [Candidatus Eremiobacteraeota bacterium]
MALESTLPRDAYFSPEIFRREQERIFWHEWFCVGREEEVPSTGDFLQLDVAGQSVLVVRTKDGRLAAHFNVCRHRGSRLVLDERTKLDGAERCAPSGNFGGAIRCPYHSWTYELDGCLRTAPYVGENDGVRKEDFPLYAVGIETWGGFIFVNLLAQRAAAEGRTLAAQLDAVPARLARYPLAQLRSARRIVYNVAANWKVILENYNECYHCAGVHPELCAVVPAFKQAGGGQLDWDRGIPHRDGAFTFTRSGTTTRAPFPGLDDDERVRHKGELIYPNFLLSLSADHVAAFTIWPRDPQRTTVICDFLFDPREMDKSGFDPSDAVEFWDLVNRQDWTICAAVQRGMQALVFEHGYYAPMESASLDIRRYVRERLG